MIKVLPANFGVNNQLLALNKELNIPVGVTLTAKVVSFANSQAVLDIAGQRLQVDVSGEPDLAKGAVLLLQTQTTVAGEVYLKILPQQPEQSSQSKTAVNQNSIVQNEQEEAVANALIKQGLPVNDTNIEKVLSWCRQFEAKHQAPINPRAFTFLLSKEWPVTPSTILMSWLTQDHTTREFLLNSLYQATANPEPRTLLFRLIMNMDTESNPILARMLLANLIQEKSGTPCFPPLNLFGYESTPELNQTSKPEVESILNALIKESSLNKGSWQNTTAAVSRTDVSHTKLNTGADVSNPANGEAVTNPNIKFSFNEESWQKLITILSSKEESQPKLIDTNVSNPSNGEAVANPNIKDFSYNEASRQKSTTLLSSKEESQSSLNTDTNVFNPDNDEVATNLKTKPGFNEESWQKLNAAISKQVESQSKLNIAANAPNSANGAKTTNPEDQEKIKTSLEEALNIRRALQIEHNQNSNLMSLMILDTEQQLHELTVEWEEVNSNQENAQSEQSVRLTIPTEHLGDIHLKARIGPNKIRVNLEVITPNVQKYLQEHYRELQNELGPDASISIGLSKSEPTQGLLGVNLWA